MRICFGLLVCTNDVVTSRCTICIATVGDGLIYGLLDVTCERWTLCYCWL